jgi:capsule polysaccharide export protein KpsE/RkpR
MITWNLNEPEADFILATLNGQPQNWTVMARAELIQKLMQQAQQKIPQVGEQASNSRIASEYQRVALGGTDD